MRRQFRQYVEDKKSVRRAAAFALLVLAGPAQAAESVLTFEDQTKSSGLVSVYAGDYDFTVGGGATSFDCNGDGFSELLLAGGENRATLFQNNSTQGGNLRFAAIESGLAL